MKTMMSYFYLFIVLTTYSSCQGVVVPEANIVPSTSPETSLCSTNYSYTSSLAVSGTASFKKRNLNIVSGGSNVSQITLGIVGSQTLPIKYAEIKITDSQNNVVQCGTTDSTGVLKALDGVSTLRIPSTSGTYTVSVNSRSVKSFSTPSRPVSTTSLNVSIKEDIYSNTLYALTGSLSSNGSTVNSLTLVADADERTDHKIKGAAFNIYNNWITTFEYLSNTSVTGSSDISCLSSKLDVFWKAGFNPYQYVYPDSNPTSLPQVSFYLRGDNELYINGGKVGNVTTADTDHFDDSVILHEIGHHIEASCGTMDSPGGTHFAMYRIDPRLAFSEGWGNFFGAHIIRNNLTKILPNVTGLPNNEWYFYNDTAGFTDTYNTSGGSSLIIIPMNASGISADFDTVVPSSYPGESHFREASISRGLFKVINTCASSPSNCAGGNGVTFSNYWTALGKTSNGLGGTSSPFRNSAKFFQKVQQSTGTTFNTNITNILNGNEALQLVGNSQFTVAGRNSWPGYAIPLVQNQTCSLVLTPRNQDFTTGKIDSDQRYTNHFYLIHNSNLAGVNSIKLKKNNTASSANCNQSLDLLLFKEGYSYNEDCTYSGSSCITTRTISNDLLSYNRSSFINEGSYDTKTISLAGINSNYFLLNVRYFSTSPSTTANTTSCVYELVDQNGAQLCPSTSY